ncbi:hypothetical protein RFI_08852 [Reticulomyxa filosa]|uniref:Uncharacterized protein n=1 Tax=Reticulomyxa filosa TaxID=46433 RepID=X6NPQ2_RETFI|nr:hypothetical protein RFI_08852 [Reticulomyxa filosa]|eukprot:ETO28280.1 hypothetical protein RFI_08852 [Reticulomyxa filosa]
MCMILPPWKETHTSKRMKKNFVPNNNKKKNKKNEMVLLCCLLLFFYFSMCFTSVTLSNQQRKKKRKLQIHNNKKRRYRKKKRKQNNKKTHVQKKKKATRNLCLMHMFVHVLDQLLLIFTQQTLTLAKQQKVNHLLHEKQFSQKNKSKKKRSNLCNRNKRHETKHQEKNVNGQET